MSDSSSPDERTGYERVRKKRRRSRSHSPHEYRESKHKKHKKHKHRNESPQYHQDSDDDRRDVRRERHRDRSPSGRRDKRGQRQDEEVKYDPHKKIKREPDDSHREQRRERERNDEKRRQARRERDRENNQEGHFRFGQGQGQGQDPQPVGAVKTEPKEKEKPNFEVSGKLTEDTNTYRGVVIKYNEPPEARKPKKRWRLYPFKGDQTLPMLHIHRQSAYLIGRMRRVADIPVDHPSCSKQHAVLQYRLTEFKREDGSVGRKVKPYIIDLGSANGTFVNNKQIQAQRYVELFEKDVLKFGYSTREYVILHEKVDTSELHEDEEGASS